MDFPFFRSSTSVRLFLLGPAVLALLFGAAVGAPGFSSNASSPPKASALETLAKMREAWVQDLHTKQLEPILKFYAPDAAFLQPNGDRLTGPTALSGLFQNIMSTFDSNLTLHSQSLETSGDLAYDSGDFEESLTVIATGAKITSKGSYIIIYKRQPGGDWRIVQQVWTGTLPSGT